MNLLILMMGQIFVEKSLFYPKTFKASCTYHTIKTTVRSVLGHLNFCKIKIENLSNCRLRKRDFNF